jgi:hypothetical protein
VHSEIKKVGEATEPSEIPSQHWSDFWLGLMIVIGFSAGGTFLFKMIFG